MLFTTNYRPPFSRSFQTTIFANSEEQAKEFIEQRKMDEWLTGPDPEYKNRPILCSEWLSQGEIARAMHTACWLGMLAVKSGVSTPMEMLNDNGLVHNISHLVEVHHIEPEMSLDSALKSIIENVIAVERKVPGMWPCSAEDIAAKGVETVFVEVKAYRHGKPLSIKYTSPTTEKSNEARP